MKKIFLACIFNLILFSAGSFNDNIKIQRTSDTLANPTLSLSTEQPKETRQLSKTDIDYICDGLYNFIYDCNDGSQILEFGFMDTFDYIYIHYIPKELPNGTNEFFQKLSPSYHVIYNEDGSVEIPVCINDSGDCRFVIKVHYSRSEGNLEIIKNSFTFLNKDDDKFNQMYATLDSDSQYVYRLSLPPNQNMTDEKRSKFLRACVYHGNIEALDELYKLVPESDIDSRYKLELAGAGISLSDGNPYQAEIFYGESNKDFPQDNTLSIVAKSLQKSKSLKELGVEEIEPNYDWESVYKIPNLQNFYEYLTEDEATLGVYKLDLDKDGLMEILIFLPGGSMGNIFWEVLHLDKGGHITDTNSGEGMQWMSLYRFKEDYFFTSEIIDFNDKELLGLEVYALNKKGKMYVANITKEKIGSEVVFHDEYFESEDHFYLEWELDGFIDTYKRYEYEALGKKIDSMEMKELFDNPNELNGFYGLFDINNDKVDDWTFVSKFFPSNQYAYACTYQFVERKTKQILDFSDYFLNQSICCIIPYESNDKNYFICVLNVNKNYVIKLIEIKGIKPIELQSWLVSVTNRILIHVDESKGSRIGI